MYSTIIIIIIAIIIISLSGYRATVIIHHQFKTTYVYQEKNKSLFVCCGSVREIATKRIFGLVKLTKFLAEQFHAIMPSRWSIELMIALFLALLLHHHHEHDMTYIYCVHLSTYSTTYSTTFAKRQDVRHNRNIQSKKKLERKLDIYFYVVRLIRIPTHTHKQLERISDFTKLRRVYWVYHITPYVSIDFVGIVLIIVIS